MYKFKKLFVSLLLVLICICSMCFMGFTVDIPKKNFIINSEAKEEFKSFTNVYNNGNADYVVGKQYNEYERNGRPIIYSSYYDIDYVVHIIRELEEKAEKFLGHNDRSSIFNIVTGFIRQLNKHYSISYGNKWDLVAGNFDASFITFSDGKSGYETSLAEFFASFLQNIDD